MGVLDEAKSGAVTLFQAGLSKVHLEMGSKFECSRMLQGPVEARIDYCQSSFAGCRTDLRCTLMVG